MEQQPKGQGISINLEVTKDVLGEQALAVIVARSEGMAKDTKIRELENRIIELETQLAGCSKKTTVQPDQKV